MGAKNTSEPRCVEDLLFRFSRRTLFGSFLASCRANGLDSFEVGVNHLIQCVYLGYIHRDV